MQHDTATSWIGARLALIAIVAVAVPAACQPPASQPPVSATGGVVSNPAAGQPTGAGETAAPSETGGAGVPAAVATIDATNLADPASVGALDAIRFTDEGAAAAAQVIAAGATGDTLWAATWIYGSAGTDPAVLKPLLTTADDSVRAMAAAALLGWGDRDGAHVLVQLIPTDGNLRGSHPPLLISTFAREVLDQYIGGPSISADATAADAAAAWTTWLGVHEGSMQFSPNTRRWTAP